MFSALAMLCFGFWAFPCAAQQTIEGDWIGGIDFEKSWQPIKLHFIGEKQNVSGTLDFPYQNRAGLSLSRVVITNGHLRAEWQDVSGLAVFEGLLTGDSISGEFTQADKRAKFGVVHTAKADPKLYE
jgi:hypothetical protein